MRIARLYRRALEKWRQPRVRFGLRRRMLRIARVAAAFVLTLTFLAIVGAVIVAAQSRVHFDPADRVLEADSGAQALQAAERILALRDTEGAGVGEPALLAQGGRRMREAAAFASAEAAALAFLSELRAGEGGEIEKLDALQDLIAAGAPRSVLAPALAALATDHEAQAAAFDWRPQALARLHYLAAARLQARARTLGDLAREGRDGPISPQAEQAFYRARGEAYAWALILRGAAHDAQTAPPDGIAALDSAAAMQPLFLFNGPREGFIVPNHLAMLALDLERAAHGLMADLMRPA